jgi:hypothetical protein
MRRQFTPDNVGTFLRVLFAECQSASEYRTRIANAAQALEGEAAPALRQFGASLRDALQHAPEDKDWELTKSFLLGLNDRAEAYLAFVARAAYDATTRNDTADVEQQVALFIERVGEVASGSMLGTSGVFRRTNGVWMVGIGTETPIKHQKGMIYIHQLLESPGTRISCCDLVGPTSAAIDAAPIEATDIQAVRDAEKRVRYIETRLMVDNVAPNIRKNLESERARILKYLGKNTNRRGQPRLSRGDERQIDAVRMAIKRALAAIKKLAPGVWHHLESSIRTGRECAYLPKAPNWKWDLG